MLKEHLAPEQSVLIYDQRPMAEIKAWLQKQKKWRRGMPAPSRYVTGVVRGVSDSQVKLALDNGRSAVLPFNRVIAIYGV